MRRIILVGLVVLIVWLGLSVARQAFQLVSVQKRIETDKVKLAELEREKADLEAEKNRRQTANFVEEEARNKLNKARPGESVVVLPKDSKESEDQKDKEQKKRLNWQKWVDLFREG